MANKKMVEWIEMENEKGLYSLPELQKSGERKGMHYNQYVTLSIIKVAKKEKRKERKK